MTRLDFIRLPKPRRREVIDNIEARKRMGFLVNEENPLASISIGPDKEDDEDPEFKEARQVDFESLVDILENEETA